MVNEKHLRKVSAVLKLMVLPKGLSAGKSVYQSAVGYQWLFWVSVLCVVWREEPKRRRYESALLEIARKNFKTYTIAILFLLLLLTEPDFSKLFSVAPRWLPFPGSTQCHRGDHSVLSLTAGGQYFQDPPGRYPLQLKSQRLHPAELF